MRTPRITGIITMLVALLVPAGAAAAAPAHDSFADARPIPVPGTDDTSTTGATTEAGEPQPSCAPVGATVWYRVEAERIGTVRAHTFGSKFDTVLAVWRGEDLASLEEVACNDDATDVGSLQSELRFQAEAGEVYHLQVGGYEGATRRLVLTLDEIYPDRFADAISIGTLPFTDIRDTAEAGVEPGEDTWQCWRMERTLWYRFTPTEDTVLRARTSGDVDSTFVVYTGDALDNLSHVTCASGYGGDPAEAFFEAKAGVTYSFQVGPLGSASGALTFALSSEPVPSNDRFEDAILLDVPAEERAYTLGASVQDDEPRPCGGIDATVWFSFTAPESRQYVVKSFYSDFDTVLAVYRGQDVDELEAVACNDDTGSWRESLVAFAAEAGETYHIQLGGFLGEQGRYTLTVNPGQWTTAAVPVAGRVDAGQDGNILWACATSRFIPSGCHGAWLPFQP